MEIAVGSTSPAVLQAGILLLSIFGGMHYLLPVQGVTG